MSWSRFKCESNKILIFFLCFDVILFIVFCVIAFKVFPDIIDSEIAKNARLRKGTEQFEKFMTPPYPLQFKVYIFSVENSDGILNNGEMPIVKEKGPYIYNQYRKKEKIHADCDEDTFSYTQTETFHFDEQTSSPLTEDDVFTVLNPAMMIMLQQAEATNIASLVQGCLSDIFPSHPDLFTITSVRELLFGGYDFCKPTGSVTCDMISSRICSVTENTKLVESQADGSLLFSFFRYKDKSSDGLFTIFRGMDKLEKLGEIVEWNEKQSTEIWGEDTKCSEVTGGRDFTVVPPRVKKDSMFAIYSTDVCRTVEINFIKEDTYKGIDGYVFGTDSQTLYPTALTPEEDCYCTNQTLGIDGEQSCFLDGVIDMQSCTKVPVLLSFPHFLWANEKYIQNVTGMKPSEELHKTFLLVEPNTGTPLQGVKRIQMNAVFRPIKGVKEFQNFQSFVLPLLWIEEGFSLPDLYVDQLNSMYFNKLRILEGVKWGLIAVTGIVAVVLFGILAKKKLC